MSIWINFIIIQDKSNILLALFFRQLLSSTWYSVMVLETWGYCGEVGGLERINKSQPPNIIYTEVDPKMNNFLGKCFLLWFKVFQIFNFISAKPQFSFPSTQQKIAGQNIISKCEKVGTRLCLLAEPLSKLSQYIWQGYFFPPLCWFYCLQSSVINKKLQFRSWRGSKSKHLVKH